MKGDAMPSARALGRGFEEISHLFLSNPAAAPVAAGAVPPAADRTQGAGPRTQLVTVRRDVSLTKAQIIAALRDSRRFFDDDLVEIGAGFACSPFGEVDLLALDRDRRLTVVEVQNALDDTLVARGLSHIDWVVRNIRGSRSWRRGSRWRSGAGSGRSPCRPLRVSVIARSICPAKSAFSWNGSEAAGVRRAHFR
jgi:hypothetical protein